MSGTLKYTDVKPEKMSFSTFKGYTLVKYMNNDMFIQSPWINIFAYGIPRKGQFNQTDNSRKCLKVPLDEKIPEVSDFVNILKEIDSKMTSNEFQDMFLGDNKDKFEYSSIYKESQTKERPSYIKLKLATENDSEQTIKTSLYKTNSNNERELITGVTNIDDFAKVVGFRSDVRFIFKVVRVWSQPPTLKNPTYGLTLKVTKIEVQSKEKGTEEGDFIDDSPSEKKVAHFVISSEESDGSDQEADIADGDEDDLCKKVNYRLEKVKAKQSPRTPQKREYIDRGFNDGGDIYTKGH
jgi:hypothetical protein